MNLPQWTRRRIAASIGGLLLLALAAITLPLGRPLAGSALQWLGPYLNPPSQIRQSVEGQVTYVDRERGLIFLQNHAAAWRVETAEVDESITTGQMLQASGAVAPGAGPLVLQSALINPLRSGSWPQAQPISGTEFFGAAVANRFVSIAGRVKSAATGRFGQLHVILDCDGQSIPVRVADYSHVSVGGLAGARVRFEGVVDQAVDTNGNYTLATLLLRDRSGITMESSSAPAMPSLPVAVDRSLPVLRRVEDIHRLTPGDADRRFPVLLDGIVTYADPAKYFFFIQDNSGGIYVDATNTDVSQVRTGRHVRLAGVTGPGLFAPVINRPRLELLGPAPLPTPHNEDLTRFLSGLEDSNWVEADAIIRSIAVDGNQTILQAQANGVAFQIYLPADLTVPAARLIDAEVHVEGVCATHFNWLRQLVGFRVLAPSMQFVHVKVPAPALDRIPMLPVLKVGSFSPASRPGHRERVQGVVTFRSGATGKAYIQDSSGAIELQGDGMGALQVGALVEATGFPTPGSFGPKLENASVRTLGQAQASVLPLKATFENLMNQGPQGVLIQIDATLVERVMSAGEEVFILRAGHTAFMARLPNRNGAAADKGSRVRVTGICSLYSRPGHPLVPINFTVLMRSPSDFQVLRQASWWTARFVLWILGAVLIVSTLVSIWALTLRRQVRRQTHVIQAQLEQAQHLTEQAESAAKVKSEFLANMSHEIRTPLNGILGMTELAMMEDVKPDVREFLQTAHLSGLSLLQILNDVLDLSKIEAGCVTLETLPFNLEQTIRGTAAILKPAADAKHLALQVSYLAASPRWFCGDPARLRQVVLNLLGNAIKFTEQGGVRVGVSVQPVSEGAPLVRIEVCDTGIGIPLDQQQKLFQNFTQADASTTRKYGGTGLGLAISKQLITLMGGTVGLESFPGKGSTFWVTVPLPLADALESDGITAAMETESHRETKG